MKRIISNIILCLGLCGALTSCWKEDYPLAGESRYKVVDLKATPGDGEVALSWEDEYGQTPQDYIVQYLDPSSETVKLFTGGAKNCTVTRLQNGFEYTFKVQACYEGKLISGVSSISATPSTERYAVTDVQTEAGNGFVHLYWTVPSTNVLYYKIEYYKEGESGNTKSVIVDGGDSDYLFKPLDNDVTWYFSIVANYAKGASDPVEVKDMPAFAVPYAFSPAQPASGQPVEFSFNTVDFPSAKDIVWTLPDGSTLSGAKATGSFTVGNTEIDNNDAQVFKVQLTANVNGSARKWSFDVPVTPFVFLKNDWDKGSAKYQGFKADVPVFSPDGKTVYVLPFQKPVSLYALDAMSGEEQWHYTVTPDAAAYNGATVNPVSGDIYFGTSSAGLIALGASGSLKWTSTDVATMNQTAFPAVSEDGSAVYVLDGAGNLTAISAASGTRLWQTAMAAKGGSILVNGDELIVGCNSMERGVAFVKTSDGSILSTIDLPDKMSDGGGFAVSPDRKTVYLGTVLGSVCAVDITTRTITATVATPSDGNTNNNVWGLAVSAGGDVFGGNKRGFTFCLDGKTLELKWSGTVAGAATANGFNYAHPCCNAAGQFMVTSGGSKNSNFLYNPDGSCTQWSYMTSANQKQMAGNAYHNGVFYSLMLGGGTENGAMVAMYVGGEDATSGWPCNGGDLCGSFCIK